MEWQSRVGSTKVGYLFQRLKRRSLVDALILGASLWVAYLLRFEFSIPRETVRSALVVTPFVVAIQMLAFRRFSVHRVVGRHFSFDDLGGFAWSAIAWLVPMLGVRFFLPDGPWRIPVSVTLIDTVLAVLGVLGLRAAQRFYAEIRSVSNSEGARPVLLVGAGGAGARVARELSRNNADLRVVGYVDDDPKMYEAVVSGAPVFGGIEAIPRLVEEHDVDHVIVAIADPPSELVQRVVQICETIPVRARTIPSFFDILQGSRPITAFYDIDVDQLLGRDPVVFDSEAEVVDFIKGRVVIVTGAGGSIGAELARQIADLKPSMLLLLERFEGALFEIHRELSRVELGLTLVPLVADINDEPRMQAVFDRYRPDVIVHAAAHKHVAMMEGNPGEAIKNNTFGTRVLAREAGRFGASSFILVSTDKAVRPSSIMGASKRLAEMVVQHCSDIFPATKYVAVRFGNVIGSSGSVIPIFREQVSKGGPVTVTHDEATRYFMTIPEATRLVLTAGAIGHGGEVMVLDMGQPVRIIDLARDLIRLTGYVPDRDINIEITGLKPGEKLHEELYSDTEEMQLTRHPKVFIGRTNGHGIIESILAGLVELVDEGSEEQLREFIGRSIPDSTLTSASKSATSQKGDHAGR